MDTSQGARHTLPPVARRHARLAGLPEFVASDIFITRVCTRCTTQLSPRVPMLACALTAKTHNFKEQWQPLLPTLRTGLREGGGPEPPLIHSPTAG